MELANKLKALIIDDEPSINELLKLNLQGMGFDVETCFDAESAVEKIKNQKFHICLLDWMLPGAQGIDFLVKLKNSIQPDIKVMMITAKADPESVVQGLDSGADDYLTKPFDSKVLAARIRNLTKGITLSKMTEMSIFEEKGLKVYLDRYQLFLNDEEIKLTISEFKLLVALIKARGKVLTRDQLILSVQGEDVAVTGRTIDTHMFALRKKIGPWSMHIETIRGVGYRILISDQDISETSSGEVK